MATREIAALLAADRLWERSPPDGGALFLGAVSVLSPRRCVGVGRLSVAPGRITCEPLSTLDGSPPPRPFGQCDPLVVVRRPLLQALQPGATLLLTDATGRTVRAHSFDAADLLRALATAGFEVRVRRTLVRR